jgi:hypothetical protein
MSKFGSSGGDEGSWGAKGKRNIGGSGEGLEGLLKGLKLSEEEMCKVKGPWRLEGDAMEKAPLVVGSYL